MKSHKRQFIETWADLPENYNAHTTREEIWDRMEKDMLEAIEKDGMDSSILETVTSELRIRELEIQRLKDSQDGWVRIEEGCKMPEENINVIVWANGALQIMAHSFIHFGDDKGEYGWVWSNCYGDIYGDAEFDDQYEPTHWMPLPQPPNHKP